MVKKTIIINEKTFELKTGCGVRNYYRYLYPNRSLWECYNRPSRTKEEIYEEWAKWAMDTGIDDFGVSSYNSQFFTLTGLYYADDGNTYFIRITPAHNYATLIY